MIRPKFTPRQLGAFTAVAELHSFRAAGERLHLTPSAVSQLVGELEKTVGFKLFDRTTRRVVISSGGKEFLGPARTVLRHFELADSAAADVRDKASGVVRVAAPQVLAAVALPAAIAAYRGSRPKVTVRIHDTAVEHLVDAVTNADVDFAVGPDRTVGEDVERRPVFSSPWVLWCAATHPLAHYRTVKWQQLRDTDLVAAGRDHELSVAQMRVALPAEERITPIDVVDNVTTALGMAAEGLGVTLAPAYVGVLGLHMGLVMRRVTDTEIVRQVSIYRPTIRSMSPAAEGFLLHLEDWLGAWSCQIEHTIENALGRSI